MPRPTPPIKEGEKYGRLTVLRLDRETDGKYLQAFCRCDCGTEKLIRAAHVCYGITVSCGCARRKYVLKNGQTFGRLTVTDETMRMHNDHQKVECTCTCGTVKLVGIPELATGITKSCGCLVREVAAAIARKHGGEGSPLYNCWAQIKRRCFNPKVAGFHSYGGRGITICDEWRNDFAAFRQWAEMAGYREDLEIDRIDVNGNYEPGNCRWVTPVINANNRRNNVLLTAFGETMTMKNWSRDPRCAVSYATLKGRIIKGRWPSAQDAISTPSLGAFGRR